MGAPKGNTFWMKRTKHGRDKIFQTPEILLDACYEYINTANSNPWKRIDFRGKDAKKVTIPVERPLHLHGLCVFLGVATSFWRDFRKRCEENGEKDFLGVITHVEEILYAQKYEGAAVGAYNANIIARDLGLRDNIDTTIDDKRKSVSELFPIDENGDDIDKD